MDNENRRNAFRSGEPALGSASESARPSLEANRNRQRPRDDAILPRASICGIAPGEFVVFARARRLWQNHAHLRIAAGIWLAPSAGRTGVSAGQLVADWCALCAFCARRRAGIGMVFHGLCPSGPHLTTLAQCGFPPALCAGPPQGRAVQQTCAWTRPRTGRARRYGRALSG